MSWHTCQSSHSSFQSFIFNVVHKGGGSAVEIAFFFFSYFKLTSRSVRYSTSVCFSPTFLKSKNGSHKPSSSLWSGHKYYSLYLKMIVLPPGYFCFKIIVRFIYPVRNLRFKVKYFHNKLSASRTLSTPQLREAFRNSCCFFILRVILTTTQSMVNGP